MDSINNYKITSCIYSSKNSVIYSAVDVTNAMQVVLKTINTSLLNANSLAKLKKEYSFLTKIRSRYVPKGLAYDKMGDSFFIALEYCTGVTISEYIKNNNISVKEFLYIAREIIKGLSDIHDVGIIHKDISPMNIIYDPKIRKVSIIDFGISTDFSYEKNQNIDLSSLEGNIYYLSPEQTGRTNYSLDFRTDFYSLGVTFFVMLCGCHPFESESLPEIIYSHIAKLPPSARSVNPKVPEMLSKIITKLMAKMPEDRYSTAAGIIFDLNKCLENFDINLETAEFELGEGDYSENFEIPRKLYGREKEVACLMETYSNIMNGGRTFVTVAGHSGIGKTSLVGELHKPIVESSGIFVSGKFDQYHINIPYFAFFQAIDQFCHIILSENEKNIDIWKARITNALGEDGRLLVEKVPRLALLSSEEQKILPDLSPLEERTKFKRVIQNLLIVMASPKKPLVMFIDDIHLADMGSLEIIEEIMSNDDINGLLIVSCHRDNEVDDYHPMILSVNKMMSREVDIQKIILCGLDISATNEMLAEALHCKADLSAELTEVVYNKTYGNPFYIKEFLRLCLMKKFIFFDRTRRKWEWNLKYVEDCPAEENVVDFLIRNINRLSLDTIKLLSFGACIGQSFSIQTLLALSGKDTNEILSNMKEAVFFEIIYPIQNRIEEKSTFDFVFIHDRFQQTFYTVLSEEERCHIHYALAKYYEKNCLETNDNTKSRFIIADNYYKAFAIIEGANEKRRVGEILLKAANAASLLSAFDTTVRYLEQIIAVFDEKKENADEFTFSVYTLYHSALCSLARYEEADNIYVLLERVAKEPLILSDSCCQQAVSLSNRGKYKDAFMLGVGLLRRLGVNFPADDQPNAILREIDIHYDKIHKGGFMGIEMHHKAVDKKEIAIGKLLNRITAAGFFYDPLFGFWPVIYNATRIMEKGYTPEGLQLYANLMLVLAALRNDYRTPYDAARNAMKLAELNGYKNELFRIYHVFSLFNAHWTEDVKNSIPYARESFKGNLLVGDFEFACYSYYTTQQAILETCKNIDELDAESESGLAFADRTGNLHARGSYVCYRQLCKSLKRRETVEGSFDDDHFNEEAHIKGIGTNSMALCYFYTLRSLSAVIYSDFDTAFELTEKAAPLMPSITGFYSIALHNILHSLAICKRIENEKCTEEEKASLLEKLSANQKWLGERAADSPINFQHSYDLIEAERNMLENKNFDSLASLRAAIWLYEKAIKHTEENARVYHYALACELAGVKCIKTDLNRTASVYLKEAYLAYLSWGATGKAEQMVEKYSRYIDSGFNNLKLAGAYLVAPKIVTDTYISVDSHMISRLRTSEIDFDAVVKASQAISGEMQLEDILDKLISVLMNNSGAQDVFYLIKAEGKFIIQAEGHSEKEVASILHKRTAEADCFPMKILHYVERTHEIIILDNATESNLYGSDEYVLSHNCKSVMCMPVINKGELKGIIYLENRLLEGAFNKQRTEALKIIASQVAISLENAYLYNNLQQLVDERTSELRKEIVIRKEAEKHLEQMANMDFLTKLPNRRMFHDILCNSIENAKMNQIYIAVLFVDLDGFKAINDKYGHDKGDVVLVTVAKRLLEVIRSCDTASRMGGDEFMLILENVKSIDELRKISCRIIKRIQEPINLDDYNTKAVVTTSIGISILNFDGDTAEELIKNSDYAMYTAKNNGKNQFAFYSKQYDL